MINIFIDSILDRMKNGRFSSMQEKDFMDTITPFIDEKNPLDNLKFNPELVPFLFRGWRTGTVYGIKNSGGQNAVYEVKNEVSLERIVFWLVDSQTEGKPQTQFYAKEKGSEFLGNKLSREYTIPKNIGEFMSLCKKNNIELKIKDFPFQQN